MADRPILFSGPMVRALLDGRKTQTRRVLDVACDEPPAIVREGMVISFDENGVPRQWPRTPAVGDRLWVREAWRTLQKWDCLAPRNLADDPSKVTFEADPERGNPLWAFGKARPSMFMPRWASRLTLVVTDVRVERLQDISEGDAIAEGATSRPDCSGCLGRDAGWSMDWSRVGTASRFARNGQTLSERDVSLGSARSAFAGFINELHDPRWNLKGDGIFGANPWVVAITFTVHHHNIDALGAKEAA